MESRTGVSSWDKDSLNRFVERLRSEPGMPDYEFRGGLAAVLDNLLNFTREG